MSSIDNSTRKSQQAELNDIQAEHNRKKRQLVKENEAQLSDIKDYYGEKKENLNETNEAAINHIRERQQKLAADAAAERTRLTENYNGRTQNVQKTYEQKLNQTRETRQEQLARAKSEAEARVQKIENDTQSRIQYVREHSSAELAAAKDKYNRDIAEINQFSEKRLEQQRNTNDVALKSETERGRSVQERQRERNEKELTKVKTTGDRQIAFEKEQHEKKFQRMNDANAKRYDQTQQQWVAKEENTNKMYSERLLHTKKENEEQLGLQNRRFQSTYQKNSEAQREAFNIQKENLSKELAETRRDFAKAASKYSEKADDPFYKVEDRGSYLRENPDFYILRAFVPAHEKDTVKVTVQNDKATVSGQRSFKDKMDDPNSGKTVSSSNFQTFREEFQFEKPVITEGMTRERQGDWVVYHIPKGIPRFDRKA